MKVLRITAVALALAIGASTMATTARAQGSDTQSSGQSGNRARGNRMMDALLAGITLTDAQKTQIDSITSKYSAQSSGAQSGPPDSAARAERRQRMMSEVNEIRAVLTSDQQQTFDKNMADMRSRMRNRNGGGGGGQ